MKEPAKRYHAKLLLFGEYSLMVGSGALSIPFRRMEARLLFPASGMSEAELRTAHNSNIQLRSYLHFLADLSKEWSGGFDIDRMHSDLDRGLYLQSNIPSGYGLGSSGVLVAAVFDRFALDKPARHQLQHPEALNTLKTTFARMENFFHGSSSGLDPLISFLDEALLIGNDNRLALLPDPLQLACAKGGFFLLDTRLSRNTAPLVASFKENYKKSAFRKIFQESYIPANNKCIDALLENSDRLPEAMHSLSDLQLRYFREMIPEAYHATWTDGLSSGVFSLKLCGAGGGGYLLGFTENLQLLAQKLHRWEDRIFVLD